MALKPNTKPVEEASDEATPLPPKAKKVAVVEEADIPEVAPKKTQPPVKLGEATVDRVDVSEVAIKDEVLITMYETIDPAPRIGTFNMQQLLGISKLVEKKNYRLPKYVAEVLVDAKKAEFLQVL